MPCCLILTLTTSSAKSIFSKSGRCDSTNHRGEIATGKNEKFAMSLHKTLRKLLQARDCYMNVILITVSDWSAVITGS